MDKKVKAGSVAIGICLLIIAVLLGGIVYFFYNANIEKNNLQAKINELETTIKEKDNKVNELENKISKVSDVVNDEEDTKNEKRDELYTIANINISSRDYEKHKADNDNNVLYDFKSKKWSNSIFGSYYLAVDSLKKLYIVDATENIIAELNVKLEKLDSFSYVDNNGRTINFQIDNYITYARVSKLQNILEIQTGDDFIVYQVDLENFSTKLAEINDD